MNEFERVEGVRSDADLDPGPGDDPEARVEQLASEIDETRDDLGQTIAEIGDKLDPANIARDAGETVKAATLGKVEQMTYGAQETWRDVRTGDTGSIVDTITSNPIPAGMVAVGLGLLFMNRGQQAQRRGADRGYDRAYDASYGRYGYDRRPASWETGRTDRGADASPLDRVGAAASDAGGRVGDVLESVGQSAEQLPQQAGYMLGRGGGQVRRFIDENPLGAGVIAMAAGAAIGMLLPTTPLERSTIGEARDTFLDKAEGAAHEALDKVEQQVSQGTSQEASPSNA